MQKIKKITIALDKLAPKLLTVLLVGLFTAPVLLAFLGVYTIFEKGYAFHFAVTLFISLLILFIYLRIINDRSRNKSFDGGQSFFVEPSSDWSEFEARIWSEICVNIDNRLKQDCNWDDLMFHSIDISKSIAKKFNKEELDFTILEGLKIIEEISSIYRKVLKEHVPGIDLIKVSQLNFLYNFYRKHGERVTKFYTFGKSGFRIFRLMNPSTAMISEMREKFLGELLAKGTENLLRNANKALLQEVAKFSIDLYSGRYQLDQSDLPVSQISKKDSKRVPPAIEPLRISIVGQTNVGKSSLLNTLSNDFIAEVDVLPSTSKVDVHICSIKIDNLEQIKLVDMPGLNGNDDVASSVLEEITNSDLVLWVLKANQSARQLDIELKNKIEQFYDSKENLPRKKPIIVGVLNQVDKLKPVADWSPPYLLSDQTDIKVKNIREAIEFNHTYDL